MPSEADFGIPCVETDTPDQTMTEELIVGINLGGGPHKLPGFDTLDPMYGEGDWKRYAEDIPWPVDDGTVEEIYASHVLEHIFAGPPRIAVFNEAHRVLQSGGLFHIRTPLFPHPCSVSDPMHVSFFVPDSFMYFCNNSGWPSGGDWCVWRMESIETSDWEITCKLRKP